MLVEYINNHQAEFWIVIGFILLAIELSLGVVTGVLLFGSIGAIITGLLMLLGVLPETWQAGIASSAICAGLVTALLWKSLKKMQNDDVPSKDNSSDLNGYEFILEQDISRTNAGQTRYSGIEWAVEIDTESDVKEILSGQRVVVSSVDVGKFRVRPV